MKLVAHLHTARKNLAHCDTAVCLQYLRHSRSNYIMHHVEMLSYAYAGIDPDAARFLKCNKDFSLSLYAASDIGIHYYGWDFNKLCDFWKDYGITDVNALKEVQRLIISSPGNYLKYYVGYLQIEKLKDSQKETLGGDYSDMEFHKAFLKIGPAPFHIIEKYINNPGIS